MMDRDGTYRYLFVLLAIAAVVSLQLLFYTAVPSWTTGDFFFAPSVTAVNHEVPPVNASLNVTVSQVLIVSPEPAERSSIALEMRTPDATGEATTSNAKKPLLLLHVGPPKSGTTTLEYGLRLFQEDMLKDGLMYCDVRGDRACGQMSNEFKKCGSTRNANGGKACWDQLRQELLDLHDTHDKAHLFFSPISTVRLSQYGMGGKPASVDWVSLKENLGDDFDIQLLFGYRRYIDWLPSAIQQLERTYYKGKWPGKDNGGGPKHEGLFPTRWKQVREPRAIKY
ncbi:MAG: hypothetical protein SGILL_005506, partial [Bacillariaceae sp.]